MPSVARPLTVDLIDELRRRAPAITVIGDLILDGWWHGRSDRLTREAPAPIVEVTERVYCPGGAANTAANLAALGARVKVVGVVGDDDNGRLLVELLAGRGIDVSDVVIAPSVTTVTKTRISGSAQVLVRVDDLQHAGYPLAVRKELAIRAVHASSESDAEIVCDYSSGALAGPVLEALVARTLRPRLTVVDAHDPRRWAALRPSIVTPNALEMSRLLDADLRAGDRAATVFGRAADVLVSTNAESAVVTLDRDGAVLLEGGEATHRTHAHPTAETRASGAGDTFVAALTLGRACGLDLPQSVDLAQAAADVVVQRPGTSVCTSADLIERLGHVEDPTIDLENLERALLDHRAAGHRIVFTNGCFDVLHRGHTGYLRQARMLGDVLVVALNGDDSVRRLKGNGRPVNPASDRAAVLYALECVDFVTVFDTDTPIPLIARLQPDVYAKGGDYTPEMLEETAAVRGYGGTVQILDYLPSRSTTAIVERIRNSAPTSAGPDTDSLDAQAPSR